MWLEMHTFGIFMFQPPAFLSVSVCQQTDPSWHQQISLLLLEIQLTQSRRECRVHIHVHQVFEIGRVLSGEWIHGVVITYPPIQHRFVRIKKTRPLTRQSIHEGRHGSIQHFEEWITHRISH